MATKAEDIAGAVAIAAERMKTGPFPFTYGKICEEANAWLAEHGGARRDFWEVSRKIDRLIQVERKAGRIEQIKRGQWVRAQVQA